MAIVTINTSEITLQEKPMTMQEKLVKLSNSSYFMERYVGVQVAKLNEQKGYSAYVRETLEGVNLGVDEDFSKYADVEFFGYDRNAGVYIYK